MSFPARPTMYKGIAMRSRLEAGFAQSLDSFCEQWTWTYEPRVYADESGQYLPDFQIDDHLFIEVKPASIEPMVHFAAMQKMHIIRSSLPAASLMLLEGTWVGNGFTFAKRPGSCCFFLPDSRTYNTQNCRVCSAEPKPDLGVFGP